MGNLGDSVEHFTGGESIGVDVPAIERDLAALWRESATGGKSVTRACLWNLVVHASNEEAVARAKALVNAIAPACPSRALVLDVRESAAPGERELEAWISANCHIAPGGGKLLCSEEITIAARASGRTHVPALVRALLVPDVPAALLWAGPAPRGEDAAWLEPLLRGADRLVVDTDDPAAPVGGRAAGWRAGTWRTLVACARAVQVVDLGWLRLSPFRVLLASCFDPPVGGAVLARTQRASVVVSPRGVATGELLLGWLAARLGWGKIAATGPGNDARTRRWSAPRPGGIGVELALEVRDVDAGHDGIWEIVIECEPSLTFRIIDAPGGPEMVRVEAAGREAREMVCGGRGDAELLVAALGARGGDQLYAEVLARAVELEP